MHIRSAAVILFLGFFLPTGATPQQATQQMPQRDAQALAVLQQSVAAQGKTGPADSAATGNLTLVEGSTTSSGTIRILTRGLDQSLEQMQFSDGNRSVTFSKDQASEAQGTLSQRSSMELAATSQCPDFPLPLLVAALKNPDSALQFIGLETLNGSSMYHLRFWNTFASNPRLQQFAEFSTRDLWIDSATGLPYKLYYLRRAATGPVPQIPVEVTYSDYRKVGGVLYPFLIQKSFNGTPWATITITSVTFNNGLTDADFSVQ